MKSSLKLEVFTLIFTNGKLSKDRNSADQNNDGEEDPLQSVSKVRSVTEVR